MEFEFYDERSKRIFDKILKKDKYKNFRDHLQSIKAKEYFFNTNRIPDNNYLSLAAFKAVEIYNTFNKREVKNNFYKFAKMSARNDKKKFILLKSKADEIIDNMVSNKYIRSSNIMLDFDFEINQKIIKHVKILFEGIGSGLYKIDYNIYLQDEFYYKYWLLMTNNYPNLFQIKSLFILSKAKIIFHSGDKLKSEQIIKFIRLVNQEINKLIRKIAPGIFINLYKNIPVVMIIDVDKIVYCYKIGKDLFEIENMREGERTSFNEMLRNDNTKNYSDFYYNRDCFDTYIPSKINNYLEPVIFSKHIRRPGVTAPTSLLFWLEIITQLYRIQLNQIDNIQNNYIYRTIKKSFIGFSKARSKLYQTDALLKLLEDSYEIEKKSFEEPYSDKFKYYLNNSDEYNVEYFKGSISSIERTKKKVNKMFPLIKEIYDRKNQDSNNKSNIYFQIIAIILTVLIILQTVFQCSTPRNSEKKDERNLNPNNKIEFDNSICSLNDRRKVK